MTTEDLRGTAPNADEPMDCEKFESALMAELYGDLDDLTSAATKRHIEGCSRCSALLGGLRATRRVAVMPWVDPPRGLERRILAAAANAKPKVVPFRARLARAVSLAGSWAMRPQTAMAAVFLVMIGTSVLLLRGKSSRAPASAYVTVTEEGTPAPAGPSPSILAAGPAPPPAVANVAPATASPSSPVNRPPDRSAAVAAPGGGAGAAAGGALAAAPSTGSWAQPPTGGSVDPPRNADMARPRAPSTNAARDDESLSTAAPTDPADELWAARTARDAAARQGRACPSGPRFDEVASRAPGSQTGWDALYEGALCYEAVGEYGNARTRLGTLLGVPSYRDRARSVLDRINKEQNGGVAGAAASPAAPSGGGGTH